MPAAGLTKVVDERLYPSEANGGGLLRREIWVDGQGRVIRYSLAYINPLMHAGDNGRVLGYDWAHGHHHRHYRGEVTAVSLDGFEQIEARFQKEWSRLAKEAKHAKH
jgi:hypothetical protein